MTHIAPHTSLSQLTALMNQGTSDITRELRATGRDLYVKTGQALFTNVQSRTEHREQATALVRAGLGHEFGLDEAGTNRILMNVFGRLPEKMTVSDLNRLNDLAQLSNKFMQGNTTREQAFQLALRVEMAVTRGTPQDEAEQRALEAARLMGPDVKPHQAWDLAPHAGGVAPGKAEAQALFATKLMAQGIGAEHAMAFAAICHAGVPEATALRLVLAAQAHLGDPPDPKAALQAAIRAEVDALPDHESANPAQKQAWAELGRLVGTSELFTKDERRTFSVGARASMHTALALLAHPKLAVDPKTAKQELRSVAMIANTFTAPELMPESEKRKLEAFHEEVKATPLITEAREQWDKMTYQQQVVVVKKVMELHAKHLEYGHEPPQLVKAQLPEGTSGMFNPVGNVMTIDPSKPGWQDFDDVFDTVVHESTHRYQKELTDQFNRGEIDPGDDRYDQARIFAASEAAPLTVGILEQLGLTDRSVGQIYRHSPIETHAFHVGGEAGKLSREW